MKSSLVNIVFFDFIFDKYIEFQKNDDFESILILSIFFKSFFNFNSFNIMKIDQNDFLKTLKDTNNPRFYLFKKFIIEKYNSNQLLFNYIDSYKNLKCNTIITRDSLCNLDYYYFDKNNVEKCLSDLINRFEFQINSAIPSTFLGWNFLKKIKLPTNSLIFFDRYFHLNINNIEDNFVKILKSLIIEKNTLFQLSIFTVNSDHNSCNVAFDYITNFLLNILKLKYIEIEIVYFFPKNNKIPKSVPHGRDILTNYFRLTSDNSFNFFAGNDLITNTKLDMIPILSGDYNNYLTKLIELKKFRNNPELYFANNVKIKNRLFDLVL